MFPSVNNHAAPLNTFPVIFLAAFTLMGVFVSKTVSAETPARDSSRCWSESDIQPQSAPRERFLGRDAIIFMEMGPGADTKVFDTVVTVGGTAAIAFKDGCAVGAGPSFMSILDFLDRSAMVSLFRTNAELTRLAFFDPAKVMSLAENGDPSAQFHVGIGYGYAQDRRASIAWLRKAAEQNFAPAMLTLGLALSGPDWLGDLEAHRVGQAFPSDKFTDRARAYYWLSRAANTKDQIAPGIAISRLSSPIGLMVRISPKERSEGRRLILERESAPQSEIDQAITLGAQNAAVFAAADQKSLQESLLEIEAKLAPLTRGPVKMTPEEAEAEFERLDRVTAELEKRVADLEGSGRLVRIPCGTVARVVRPGKEQSQVEILSGRLKGKTLYVESRDIIK